MTSPRIASSRFRRSSTAHCVITPGPPGLRADEQREGVERRVPGDADRRLELVEPSPGGLGRVRRQQRGALLQVRDVRLVAGVAPGAQLLQRHHQLDRVEHPDDAGQLGGRQPATEPHELVARHVDVDEHPREALVRERHGLTGDLEVEPVGDEEPVDHVELRAVPRRRAG